jgi:hypothetical protein
LAFSPAHILCSLLKIFRIEHITLAQLLRNTHSLEDVTSPPAHTLPLLELTHLLALGSNLLDALGRCGPGRHKTAAPGECALHVCIFKDKNLQESLEDYQKGRDRVRDAAHFLRNLIVAFLYLHADMHNPFRSNSHFTPLLGPLLTTGRELKFVAPAIPLAILFVIEDYLEDHVHWGGDANRRS